MTDQSKSVLWWIFAFIFMMGIAYYQRTTGPTYPVRGKAVVGGETIKYKLIRTFGGDGDAPVEIEIADTAVKGNFTYKRFKSNDSLTSIPMMRKDGKLVAYVPHQPPAGKVQYEVTLSKGSEEVKLNDKPVVIRFKGDVPPYIMIPHILCMFLAMVFSTRAGIEALRKGTESYKIALWTLITLFIGGIILGPFVQKFAFNAYWTGWPWGHDMTDNKTAAAFIGWVIALIMLRKNKMHRGWVIAASIIMLAVYLIPHSVLGSEIDYTKKP
jgi:hypothetical protein